MRVSTSGGLALALMLAGGLAACNEGQNASNAPLDEPAQTGSIATDPAAPPVVTEDPAMAPADPAIEPAPVPPVDGTSTDSTTTQ